MIELFLPRLDTKIRTLPWVERYGSLVRTMTTKEEVSDERFKEYRFPVSVDKEGCSDIVKQCYQQGYYQSMVPNDQFKSIVYIEDRSGLRITRITGSKGRISEFTSELRVVAWVNGKKVTSEHCSVQSLVTTDLFKVCNFVDMKPTIKGVNKISFTVEGTILNTKQQVFDSYTYNDDAPFFHPHYYTALRLRMNVRMLTSCFDSLQLTEPGIC